MSKSIWEIEREINEIMIVWADTAEGITDPDELEAFEDIMAKSIEDIGGDIAQNVDSYGHTISKIDAEVERTTVIIDKLKARNASANNRVSRMKLTLLSLLDTKGEKKIKGELFTANVTESKKVDAINETLLPDEYYRTIPAVAASKVPDKKLITVALKAEKEVPGAKFFIKRKVTIK